MSDAGFCRFDAAVRSHTGSVYSGLDAEFDASGRGVSTARRGRHARMARDMEFLVSVLAHWWCNLGSVLAAADQLAPSWSAGA